MSSQPQWNDEDGKLRVGGLVGLWRSPDLRRLTLSVRRVFYGSSQRLPGAVEAGGAVGVAGAVVAGLLWVRAERADDGGGSGFFTRVL